MTPKKYLLDIGFDDAHLPELFNYDDKSTYTIPEIMKGYAKLKLKEASELATIKEVAVENTSEDLHTAAYKAVIDKDSIINTPLE